MALPFGTTTGLVKLQIYIALRYIDISFVFQVTTHRVMCLSVSYYELDFNHTDSRRLKRERTKARELRRTPWWRERLARGVCHYCNLKFDSELLTMDHIVPIARGGESVKSNIVLSCKSCNSKKGLGTPVDQILDSMQNGSSSNNE